MSDQRNFIVTFSDTSRWQTTVSAANADEAASSAEALWDSGGVDGDHPFELLDDCIFDQAMVHAHPEHDANGGAA